MDHSFGKPAYVEGGWLEVCETDAEALEARSVGLSLTAVGWWLSLLGHPQEALSLY